MLVQPSPVERLERALRRRLQLAAEVRRRVEAGERPVDVEAMWSRSDDELLAARRQLVEIRAAEPSAAAGPA